MILSSHALCKQNTCQARKEDMLETLNGVFETLSV